MDLFESSCIIEHCQLDFNQFYKGKQLPVFILCRFAEGFEGNC